VEDCIEVHILNKYVGYNILIGIMLSAVLLGYYVDPLLSTIFFIFFLVILVAELGHMLLTLREVCMVSDEGLYMEHLLFPERIPFDKIAEVNLHTKRKGCSGPGIVTIDYVKTWLEIRVMGMLPVIMRVKDRKEVLDLLKSKCPTLRFR